VQHDDHWRLVHLKQHSVALRDTVAHELSRHPTAPDVELGIRPARPVDGLDGQGVWVGIAATCAVQQYVG
jgi:hypothetical protein